MLLQKQQIIIPPLQLKKIIDDELTVKNQEENISKCDYFEKQNGSLRLSKSFHQDLIRSDSEYDFVLNHKGIQSNILKHQIKKNNNHIEMKSQICCLKNKHGDSMRIQNNSYVCTGTKTIKDQDKQFNQQSFIINTPTKLLSQNIDNRSFTMRKTASTFNPTENFTTQNDKINMNNDRLDKNNSINKLKSQQKQSSRCRSFTLQDAIIIKGKNNTKNNLYDEMLERNQISINIKNYIEKKKQVIYSQKSVVIGNSLFNALDRQNFSVNSKRNPIIKSPEIQAIQVNNNIKNQSFSQHDHIQTDLERSFLEQSQLQPLSPEYNHQKFRPFKLPQSPYSRQNKKPQQDFQNDQLSSPHQQNYLALFPVNSLTNSPEKCDYLKNIEENEFKNELDDTLKYQFSNYFFKHKKAQKKKSPGFKYLQMNNTNTSYMYSQQVPKLFKNIILPRNENYSKTFIQEKLRPIRIQDRN